MSYLIIVTFAALLLSFLKDRNKTYEALKKARHKFTDMLVPLLLVIVFVSFALYFISGELISEYLSGSNRTFGVIIASLLGSISVMPGFIAFPLGGLLKDNGVPYMVISAFTTTLMMVGILTFPIEKRYFGFKVALIRNIFACGIAILVALITGIYFGEIAI